MATKTKTKAGKKEAPKPEVTLEQLIAVAEDFNSFMFADPEEGIDLDLEYEGLLAEVTETAEELEATDAIQFETAETLNALDVKFTAAVDGFDEPGEEEAGEETSEDDEKEEAAKAADIAMLKKTKDIEKMKTVAKAYGIRIPPPHYKDIAKLREYLIGKLDGSAPVAEKKEKPAKAEKKEKAPKAPTVGINDFFEKVIPDGLGEDQHEDEVVLLAKKEFPDKPYRVIGNALYAYNRKFVK